MSHGPGRLQRAILAILGGDTRVYRGGPLDTSELLKELEERGEIDPERPRKERMGKVVRAAAGLIGRGVAGTYTSDANNPGRRTVTWELERK